MPETRPDAEAATQTTAPDVSTSPATSPATSGAQTDARNAGVGGVETDAGVVSNAGRGGEARRTGVVERVGDNGGGASVNGGGGREKASSSPLVELTKLRLREFLREPEAVFWVFVFPIVLGVVLGIAFRNTGPEKIRVAVESGAGQAGAASSVSSTNSILAGLARSPDVEAVTLAPEEAAQALRSGRVALVVRAPQEPDARRFDYRYDPTRPESRTARLVVDDALQRAAGRADVAGARDETVTEPGARYIDFLIPGLIGMNLMLSSIFGVGFAVVQARMRKLLKLLSATPMRRSHYLLSFTFSRLIFLVPELVFILGIAWLLFGVEINGSLVSVGAVALLGALTFGGLGLLVGARPVTIQGVSGLMNLVTLPMYMFSGVFFSTARFPPFLQPFIKALPLTALNDALRAVINDGASLASQWPQFIVLAVWGVISFVVALKVFRWQ